MYLQLAHNIKKYQDMQINITNFIMYDKTNISMLYYMTYQKKYNYDGKDIEHKTSYTHNNTNNLDLYFGGAQFESHLEYEL